MHFPESKLITNWACRSIFSYLNFPHLEFFRKTRLAVLGMQKSIALTLYFTEFNILNLANVQLKLRKGSKENFTYNGSFHEAIAPGKMKNYKNFDLMTQTIFLVLVMAQCFTIMPINNVTSRTVAQLNFSWWSAKTIYCCTFNVASILFNVIVISWSFMSDISFDKIGKACNASEGPILWTDQISKSTNKIGSLNRSISITVPIIFYTSCTYARICFVILAMQWPALMTYWRKVEKKLPPYESIRERAELAYKIKMTSIIIMTLSLSKLIC